MNLGAIIFIGVVLIHFGINAVTDEIKKFFGEDKDD